MRIYSIAALALAIALPAIAADIYVPYIAPTIQDAMNVANPGDRILIEDGAYYESDIVVADGVTVAPMRGDATTVVIDAQGTGRVFLLEGLQLATSISGLTLTGGYVADGEFSRGGGVYVEGCAEVTIDHCFIDSNSAERGGAVGVWDSSAEIRFCTISGNAGTWGGGFHVRYSEVLFYGCTIVEGSSSFGGGGYIYDCAARMQNCIVAYNTGNNGDHFYQSSGDVIELSCSDVFGNIWQGQIADQIGLRGNINDDPLFCGDDSLGSPYRLWDVSPCVATNGGCGQMGAHWIGCSAVAVEDDTPHPTAITRCYPNPFNPRVTIEYAVAADGPVELAIYGVDGRRVRHLKADHGTAGTHSLTWDGCDDSGNAAPTGTYFCRLTAGGESKTTKMVLVR